jgi:hypothetical protein
MKKIISLCLTILVLALLSGSGWAASTILTIVPGDLKANSGIKLTGANINSNDVTVNQWWVENDDLSLKLGDSGHWPGPNHGLYGDRVIGYACPVALNTGSTLTFTFSGGELDLSQGNPDLIAFDTGAGAWVKVGTLADYSTDSNGNQLVRMQISSIVAGQQFFAADGSTLPAGAADALTANAGIFFALPDSGTPPAPSGFTSASIVIPQAMGAGQSASVAVTGAWDDTGQPLEVPLHEAPVKLATIVADATAEAFTVRVAHVHDNNLILDAPATSTIDALTSPSRNYFVAETNGDTDPNLSWAILWVSYDYSNTAEYDVDIVTSTEITAQVYRAEGEGTGIGDAWAMAGGPPIQLTQFSDRARRIEGWETTHPFTGLWLTAFGLYTDADDSTLLKEGSWKLWLIAHIAQGSIDKRINLVTDLVSHVWTINGWQGVYPYFNGKAQADGSYKYGSSVVLNNGSSVDAVVLVDVISSSSAAVMNDLSTYTGLELGELKAGQSKVYLMDELARALNLPGDGSDIQRNALRFTVTAPIPDVTGTAFMSDPTGAKRTMPLLTGDPEEYRQN